MSTPRRSSKTKLAKRVLPLLCLDVCIADERMQSFQISNCEATILCDLPGRLRLRVGLSLESGGKEAKACVDRV